MVSGHVHDHRDRMDPRGEPLIVPRTKAGHPPEDASEEARKEQKVSEFER